MRYDLIIKSGTVVRPEGSVPLDVAVSGGKIAALLPPGAAAEAEAVLDICGKLLYPGFIDCHTHMNEPGFTHREDFAHGSAAALAGGVTTVVDMPMNNIPATATGPIFMAKREFVKPSAYTDYAMWGAMVNYNQGDMMAMHDLGAVGFKCFLCKTGDDYTRLTPSEAERALETIAAFGGMGGFHCEDFDLTERLTAKYRVEDDTRRGYLLSRPLEAEKRATAFVLETALKKNARVHICHVSHPDIARMIREARLSGIRVTAETCPHYLIFSEDDYIKKGPLYKCSPPLREREAANRMWEALADGSLDCVCSDHSPAPLYEKRELGGRYIDVWNGISGVQTTAQGLYQHLVCEKGLPAEILARVFSANPARAFGLYGRKGDIREGFDADFCVMDPDKEWEITPESLLYMHPVSAFLGLKGRGLPVMSILRGRVAAKEGRPVSPPSGEYVPRG